jgi:two-component system response regulator LytT
MKVLIIEDEQLAARRLENMMKEFDPGIEVIARLESVSESIEWFQNHQEPDLIFLDIHLEDNVSFAIFNEISIKSPIVFTTATDELSTRIFALRKIDYLLKPIIQKDLNRMLLKYKNFPEEQKLQITSETFKEFINRNK